MLSEDECEEIYGILGMIRMWRPPTIRINNTIIRGDFGLLDIQPIDTKEQSMWSYDIPDICYNFANKEYQRIFNVHHRTVSKLIGSTWTITAMTNNDILILREIYNQISELSTFAYINFKSIDVVDGVDFDDFDDFDDGDNFDKIE